MVDHGTSFDYALHKYDGQQQNGITMLIQWVQGGFCVTLTLFIPQLDSLIFLCRLRLNPSDIEGLLPELLDKNYRNFLLINSKKCVLQSQCGKLLRLELMMQNRIKLK
jgi:hypothetical protein